MSSSSPSGTSSRSPRGGSRSHKRPSQTTQNLIASLRTHRINTLTELCRAERAAASTDDSDEALAFQEPMTIAWNHYVDSNQLLAELRGLTRAYPFSGAVVSDALARVRSDPDSNRSWNLAWLVLVKIRDEALIDAYAVIEAGMLEMWGGRDPSWEEQTSLAACFTEEWKRAMEVMLRHWTVDPVWY